MRVAVFTDADFDRATNITTTLAALLRHAPPDVRPRIYSQSDLEVDEPEYLTLRSPVVPLRFHGSPSIHLPRLRELQTRLVADDIRVIHVTTAGPMGLAGRYLGHLTGLPLIGSIHRSLVTETSSSLSPHSIGAIHGMLVIPGAEVTQNSFRAKQNAHVIALGIKQYISADQPAIDVLRDIRQQGALSIACHPHHRTTRRVEIITCYLWDHRQEQELSDLVDVWEAANRDDLFSVTSLKHYPYVANSDSHKPKHLYSWKTLLKCDKTWPAVKRALRSNVDIALTLFRNGARGAS